MFLPILFADSDLKDDMAGSTAIVVVIKDGKIFCVSIKCFHRCFIGCRYSKLFWEYTGFSLYDKNGVHLG